ncbi:hypothetical protein PR202_gb23876 [Eleusine coracana subsp. coracana]|uniref:DUF641 domain-containing protein n=1 Tax=Eleusine coracana subsp. coracana TaxID=191504 RepID=A0AAV5FJJ3_ELECO|nr:hypothetical protein PR202_gb23876 [Eleusine coracana subsp. coracana]
MRYLQELVLQELVPGCSKVTGKAGMLWRTRTTTPSPTPSPAATSAAAPRPTLRRATTRRRSSRSRRGGRRTETLLAEVFHVVSGMRRAYVALQGAHCPWNPDKMRSADAVVVVELRHLARLRDRFRRATAAGGRLPPRADAPSPPPLRKAVAPYEAALDDLRRGVGSTRHWLTAEAASHLQIALMLGCLCSTRR